jgi:hypothetical protein
MTRIRASNMVFDLGMHICLDTDFCLRKGFKVVAPKPNRHQSVSVQVPSIILFQILEDHGTPHCLKCDIEGADLLFTEHMKAGGNRPTLMSVEAIAVQLFEHLRGAGYQRFTSVNQTLHYATKPPQPPLEGIFADVQLNGHMSGLFDRELPSETWLDFDE